LKELSNRYVFLLFLALGFILYGNTLGHDFTLDDALVITDNDFTKKGVSGIWDQLSNDQFVGFYGTKKDLVSGGRYRPLSMAMFNIHYALGGDGAFLGHLNNVLFYIMNGFLLFLLLKRLFKKYPSIHPMLPFPLLVSLLWFFHPIHTEVIANIKGLDEIMAFGFELITLWFLLNYLDHKKIKDFIFMVFFYFVALLSKENAITWMALIPITVYFFTNHKLKKAVIPYAGLFLAAAVWFFIRFKVVGGSISNVADNLMNDPFLESSVSEKYATIMLTLGKYIQLLFFPHPLTYDYYPKHIPIVGWGNPLVILSIFFYAGLIFVAIKGFMKKNIVAYGILIYFITLSIASNIVFPIGAFMNERFIYVSSLGFCIIIAYFMAVGLPKIINNMNAVKNLVIGGLATILLLFSVKTISRNMVWKNNLSLATHDANVSVNGAKSNVMAGGLLTEEAAKIKDPLQKQEKLKEAIFYLNRAVTTYPEYIDALLLMGNAQWDLTKNINNSMPYYQAILGINPYHANTWQNCFIILEQSKDVDSRITAYQTLLRYNPNKPKVYLNLGRAYGREKNDLKNAQLYLEQGRKIAPNNIDILSNLGTLYGIQQNYSAAIEVLEIAKTIKPDASKLYIDLGLSYFYSGQAEKAKTSFDQAAKIDPKVDRSIYPI